MRLIDGDELYQKVVGYNGGAVDKTVAKRLIDQMPTIDAVSRQAAIDTFEKELSAKYNRRELAIGFVGVKSILENLPSAQPERIKGHWVEIASSNHTYKCSVCGRLLVNITDGKNNVAKNYPYCHCGADMRGKQDE